MPVDTNESLDERKSSVPKTIETMSPNKAEAEADASSSQNNEEWSSSDDDDDDDDDDDESSSDESDDSSSSSDDDDSSYSLVTTTLTPPRSPYRYSLAVAASARKLTEAGKSPVPSITVDNDAAQDQRDSHGDGDIMVPTNLAIQFASSGGEDGTDVEEVAKNELKNLEEGNNNNTQPTKRASTPIPTNIDGRKAPQLSHTTMMTEEKTTTIQRRASSSDDDSTNTTNSNPFGDLLKLRPRSDDETPPSSQPSSPASASAADDASDISPPADEVKEEEDEDEDEEEVHRKAADEIESERNFALLINTCELPTIREETQSRENSTKDSVAAELSSHLANFGFDVGNDGSSARVSHSRGSGVRNSSSGGGGGARSRSKESTRLHADHLTIDGGGGDDNNNNGNGEHDVEEYAELAEAYAELSNKERWTRRLLVLALVAIVALAISFGISYYASSSSDHDNDKAALEVPDSSTASSSPSSSMDGIGIVPPSTTPPIANESPNASASEIVPPSFSPLSKCSSQVSSNRQTVHLRQDYMYNPNVALDGKNMAITVRDIGSSVTYTLFYSFHNSAAADGDANTGNSNDGGEREWIMQNSFREEYTSPGSYHPVAISGNTALVGVHDLDNNNGAGSVSIYEQNDLGVWDRAEDQPYLIRNNVNNASSSSSSSQHGFGLDVDIDGDLACVLDYRNAHLFRRDDDDDGSRKWVQFASLNDVEQPEECTVAGDTIAIRGYDVDLDGDDDGNANGMIWLYGYDRDGVDGLVVPLQDPIIADVSSMDMSRDTLVYWDLQEKDAFIYSRGGMNESFAFLQITNLSVSGYNQLALNEYVLVIGGENETHIFSKQESGYWADIITLDQSYDRYQVSSRNLLVANEREVYSFNSEDCAPSMPAISIVPTPSCYWLDIAIEYDDFPVETSWEIQRIGTNDDDDVATVLVKSYSEMDQDVSTYMDLICLQEGEYVFAIYDSRGDGICCERGGEGNYNVTLNGALVVQGGEFGDEQRTSFSIPPIISAPSAPSSIQSTSPSPESSLPPSIVSSSSPPPSFRPSSIQSTSPSSASLSPSEAPSSSPLPTFRPSSMQSMTPSLASLPPSQAPSSTSSPPSFRPSSLQSMNPSSAPSSLVRFLSPSMSPSPTNHSALLSGLSSSETCYWIEIAVVHNTSESETWWIISTIKTTDGVQEKKLVADSSPIELIVDGMTYSAARMEHSPTKISVKGRLCNCGFGFGTNQCDCEGDVCLIKRGGTFFDAKVANCERGGGLAAIIYNNVEGNIISPTFGILGKDNDTTIPALFISQADGEYLLENSLGGDVAIRSDASIDGDSSHNVSICLEEGEYEFTIYDSRDDDAIDLLVDYNITSNGELIVQGGEFENEETSSFSIPFEPPENGTDTLFQQPPEIPKKKPQKH